MLKDLEDLDEASRTEQAFSTELPHDASLQI
jgi:hypothetical protein